MRYREIIAEAPVSDISVHGSPLSDEGSFDQTNRRYIDKAILNKVYHQKLAKLPFDLSIYILNKAGLEQHSQKAYNAFDLLAGEVKWGDPPVVLSADRKTYPIPELAELRGAVAKDRGVHLIVGNNFVGGGPAVPLTPWMTTHRLLHCMPYDNFDLHKAFPNMQVFSNAARHREHITQYQTPKRISWWDVASMASVRHDDPEFDNDNELGLEMAVEYLYTGNIRVNKEKVAAKCAQIGLDSEKVFANIDACLMAYKQHLDALVKQMNGRTFYI